MVVRSPYRDAFQRPGFALVLLPSEGPRPTAANGQPSGAPLGGDIAALSTAYPYRALRTERSYGLGTSTQGVWFENPRGPIALLLPAAAGVPVSFRRLPQAPRPSSRDTDGLQLASSWTRDEWESNATARGGDKWCAVHAYPRGVESRALTTLSHRREPVSSPEGERLRHRWPGQARP